MIRDINDAELEEFFGRLERANTDRLSDLMRMVGLDPLTDLRHADVRGANLSGQDFTHADLEGADLHFAQMSRTRLNRAKLHGADLSHSNLSHSNLSHADLSDADLSDANLSHADLSDADLSGALMTGANLDGANLDRANLSGTKIARSDDLGSGLAVAAVGRVSQAIGGTSYSVHIHESPPDTAELRFAAQPALGSWRTRGEAADVSVYVSSGPGSSAGFAPHGEDETMTSPAYMSTSTGYADADATFRSVETAVQAVTDNALQLSEARSSGTSAPTRLSHTHPLTALAMAAGAGFILAKLLDHRK